MVLKFLPGGLRATKAMGTGWSVRSSSLAGPASSVVIRAPVHPDSVAGRQHSELFYESGIYFRCNQAASMHASQVLGTRGYSALGSCFS